MLWQDVDCDVAIEPLIARAADLAHATAAEKRHNFMRSEPGTDVIS